MTGSAKQSTPLRHCERSEAIHLAAQRKNGLLRRYAPRNDGATLSVIASAASRMSAPDGLSEAIHASPSLRAQRSNPCRYRKKNGLLRRYAPRNDGVTIS